MSCTAAHDQRTGTEPSVASRKDAASASEKLQHSASWAAALVSSVAAPDSMRDESESAGAGIFANDVFSNGAIGVFVAVDGTRTKKSGR